MKKYKQISQKERDLIAVWKAKGFSLRQIAKRLNRSPSTISREIKRNSLRRKHYIAIHAQDKVNKRKILSRKRHSLKSKDIYSYVLDKLKQGWSPEQISGRLKLETGKKIISYETIYRFIYKEKNKKKKLWEYLPRKQKKRKKKYGRKAKRVKIPNRVSIHLRDKNKSIADKKAFGHWEGDLVIGRQTKGKIIHTEVERKTRFFKALLINNKDSTETIKAQIKIFKSLPKRARKSTTLDNGLEFVKHNQLKKKLTMKTFFCDPYSSWQRGSNEYHNGLVRRYLPKRVSFENITQGDLDDIVWEINNRPRKVLNYYTPREVFDKELKVNGVAVSS